DSIDYRERREKGHRKTRLARFHSSRGMLHNAALTSLLAAGYPAFAFQRLQSQPQRITADPQPAFQTNFPRQRAAQRAGANPFLQSLGGLGDEAGPFWQALHWLFHGEGKGTINALSTSAKQCKFSNAMKTRLAALLLLISLT